MGIGSNHFVEGMYAGVQRRSGRPADCTIDAQRSGVCSRHGDIDLLASMHSSVLAARKTASNKTTTSRCMVMRKVGSLFICRFGY
jgi:hypothetical protein